MLPRSIEAGLWGLLAGSALLLGAAAVWAAAGGVAWLLPGNG